MTDKPQDSSSIHWIRDEIEKNTESAITALEGYFEHSDNEFIRTAQKALHEIYGTLQIVELYPPSTLANEIEKTLGFILEHKVKLDSDAISEIIQSITLIVRYIDSSLLETPTLKPENLIEPLNILRVLRQERTVAPMKPPRVQPFNDQKLDDTNDQHAKNRPTLAIKLLKLYQFSYLRFVQNEDPAGNLVYMAQAVQRFSKLFPQQNLLPLWSALSAALDSLMIDEQHQSVESINEYLGKISHLLKIFSSPKTTQITSKVLSSIFSQTLDILKNLQTKTVLAEQVLTHHGSDTDSFQTSAPQKTTPGVNKATLVALGAALAEEIGYVKDTLDIFSRSNNPNITDLTLLYNKIKQLSDSMILIEELEIPRQALEQQILLLDRLIITSETPQEDWLIELATALLFVESSAERITRNQKNQNFTPLDQHDILLDARNAVLRETLVDLAKVKSLYVDSISSVWNHENLQHMQILLRDSEARLFYIDEMQAIQLIEDINQYIQYDLSTRFNAPDWPDVEKFADIIAALDQYLYLKIENKSLTPKLLDQATIKLKTLHTLSDEQKASLPEFQNILETQIELPDTTSSNIEQLETQPEQQASTSTPNQEEDEDDQEIREIFLEELQEIVDELQVLLHTISANLEDTGCLVNIRRLVHIIKGSGRVAKVDLISEPALQLEKLLNDLLDNNATPTPPLLNLITDFINQSPKIAAEITSETRTLSAYFVESFSNSKTQFPEQNQTDLESDSQELNEINEDSTIQDETPSQNLFSAIQINEIETHFSLIYHYFISNKDYISQAPQDPTMLRAAHTLKAIFKSTSHQELSDDYSRFEALLRTSFKSNQHRSSEFFAVLKNACEVIQSTIQDTEKLKVQLPLLRDSLDTLEILLDKMGSHNNPYETWLEQNYHVFDILLQNKSNSTDPLEYQNNLVILKTAATDAALKSLNQLESLLLLYTEYLELLWEQNEAVKNIFQDTTIKLQESLLSVADRIAMGQERIELEPMEQIFQAHLEMLQSHIQKETTIEKATQETNKQPETSKKTTSENNNTPAAAEIEETLNETEEETEEDIALIFKQELTEILESIEGQLQYFLNENASLNNLQELQRDYHTIKGGAEYINEKFLCSLAKEADLICERFLDARKVPPRSVISTLVLTQHLFKDRLAKLPNIEELSEEEVRIISDLKATKPVSEWANHTDEAEVPPELEQEDESALKIYEDQELDETASAVESDPLVNPKQTAQLSLVIHEDNQDIIEIFLEEAEDLLTDLGSIIRKLHEDTTETDLPTLTTRTLRLIHTIKGGALLSGIEPIGTLAHDLEHKIENHSQENVAQFTPDLEIFSKNVNETLQQIKTLLKNDLGPLSANVRMPETPASSANHPNRAQEANTDKSKEFVNIDSQLAAPDAQNTELTLAPTQSHTDNSNEEMPTTNPNALSPEIATDTESLADYDQEILEIFYEESHELVEELEKTVGQIEENQITEVTMDQLKRILHTLKGSARLAGFPTFGNEAHVFESHLETLRTPTQPEETAEVIALNDSLFATLQKILKSIEHQLQQSQATPVEQTSREISQNPQSTIQVQPHTRSRAAKRKKNTEVVRVGADLLEKLVNLAGETMISRSSVQQELLGFTRIIDEFGLTLDRIREQIRNFENETESRMLSHNGKNLRPQLSQEQEVYGEFDTLEMDRFSAFHQLARSLSESASDLIDMRDTMLDKVRTTETLVMQQSRIQTELHEGLMQSRMVPFSRLAPRLTRMVRQIADELGKKAELTLINAEGEMDRSVLERMIPPLEHMLRNALDHGIELPEIREAQNKNPVGKIVLHLFREGNEIVLRISDDGAGIDVDKVRAKAIKQGMLSEDSQLTEKEILQFIFKPGFSTATKVTQISGRGVGMDVVFSEIKQLNGSLKIHAAPNVGTQFTIRLPFTVSMSRALMVQVGEDDFAIPLTHIEGVVRVSPYELNAIYEDENSHFYYADKQYEVKYLGQYLNGRDRNTDIKESVPLILARNTERSIAVQVDQLIGSREIVVKNTGAQLSQVIGLSGATILPDGSVVIILDLNALIRDTIATGILDEQEALIPAAPVVRSTSNPLIMVVDDSVTVRKVTSRLLERHGMEVITAKDGIDAVTQLRDVTPSLILLDIEMPRMDGFEVASHIRHDPRLSEIPIIMISSRTGEKHRTRANSLGVNEFLGKPYQELQLLEYISSLVLSS